MLRILSEDGRPFGTEGGQGLRLETWSQPRGDVRRMVRLRRLRHIVIGRASTMVDTPHRWEDKDPSDVWPYTIDFSGWCGASGETASRLTIVPAPDGLIIESWVVTPAGLATVVLAGGVAGVDYAVRVALTTVSERVLERTVMIQVRDL